MSNTHRKIWNSDFFLLWQGQFVSLLGSQAFFIAMMFWIKQNTGSATLMGLLMMSASIPGVLFNPIGGTIADRYSRKTILIMTDTINGMAVLTLATSVFLLPAEYNQFILVHMFIVAVLLGSTGAFFRPAILACLPDLVPKEKLNAANSIGQATMQIAQLLGNSVGGVLFRVLGAPLMFLIDGISYLISAFSESFINLPDKSDPSQKDESKAKKPIRELFHEFWQETKDGLHYLLAKKGMREFFTIGAIINFFMVPASVLLPFYVEDHLQATTDWYGFIIAALGVGSLIGYAIAGVSKPKGFAKLVILSVCFILMSCCITAMGFIDDPYVALLLMAIIGLCNGIINVNMLTIIQLHIDDDMRGRMFGLLGTLTGSIIPIAMGLSGIIFDLLDRSIPRIYGLTGVILIVTAGLVSLSKNYRYFLTSDPDPNAEIALDNQPDDSQFENKRG